MIVSDKAKKLEDVMKGVEKIAQGSISHIGPLILNSGDLKELTAAADEAKDKAKSEGTAANIAKAIYTAAAIRDSGYAIKGRKFMRVAGLNGVSRAAWGRYAFIQDAE